MASDSCKELKAENARLLTEMRDMVTNAQAIVRLHRTAEAEASRMRDALVRIIDYEVAGFSVDVAREALGNE